MLANTNWMRIQIEAQDQGENLCQGWDDQGWGHEKSYRRGGFGGSQEEKNIRNIK